MKAIERKKNKEEHHEVLIALTATSGEISTYSKEAKSKGMSLSDWFEHIAKSQTKNQTSKP